MVHLAVLSLIYFLPTIIAAHRGHSVSGIATLNFLFGWTGIGWIAMLLWALIARPAYYIVPAPTYYPYGSSRR